MKEAIFHYSAVLVGSILGSTAGFLAAHFIWKGLHCAC